MFTKRNCTVIARATSAFTSLCFYSLPLPPWSNGNHAVLLAKWQKAWLIPYEEARSKGRQFHRAAVSTMPLCAACRCKAFANTLDRLSTACLPLVPGHSTACPLHGDCYLLHSRLCHSCSFMPHAAQQAEGSTSWLFLLPAYAHSMCNFRSHGRMPTVGAHSKTV